MLRLDPHEALATTISMCEVTDCSWFYMLNARVYDLAAAASKTISHRITPESMDALTSDMIRGCSRGF
jgi:hypothetical protein